MRRATTSLYGIAIFDAKNDLLSNYDGYDGQTTQGKPLRHITPGQENIEIYRRILHGREKPSYSWTSWLKLVVCAVAVIPTSKRYLAEENVASLGTHLYPQLHIRSRK